MADYRVEAERDGMRRWTVRNDRGAEVRVAAADDGGGQPSFTPVELLLAALAGCGGLVIDRTARAVEHDALRITVESSEAEGENRLSGVRVSYLIDLPPEANGGRAEAVFERGVRLTHEKYCTVSRTVEHGAWVEAVYPSGETGFAAGPGAEAAVGQAGPGAEAAAGQAVPGPDQGAGQAGPVAG